MLLITITNRSQRHAPQSTTGLCLFRRQPGPDAAPQMHTETCLHTVCTLATELPVLTRLTGSPWLRPGRISDAFFPGSCKQVSKVDGQSDKDTMVEEGRMIERDRKIERHSCTLCAAGITLRLHILKCAVATLWLLSPLQPLIYFCCYYCSAT